LFLPVDLIGRPFSQKTRDHFLPLLTSTHWWSQTQLALRKVFQTDKDFQERMFARQIAVMKGQAWNVVETLKTADHGPLELTRRAKVCVWDDLVDVPVAVPMRAPSADMLRRTTDGGQDYLSSKAIGEEMDIGAATSSSAPRETEDLLNVATPPADLPHPGRFEIATPTEELAADYSEEQESARQSFSSPATRRQRRNRNGDNSASRRPGLPRGAAAASYQGSPRLGNPGPARQQERRYSFAMATARRNSGSLASHFFGYDDDDDDLDGDLGYAAAEGMEGHQRKVIVERLEAVKSKNPVFTWC
jgi:phosphatidylinositol 4-kinase type 2